MDSIAKLLKDAREDMDLTQKDVMEKTGISDKSLSRYENNITEPDLKTLTVLCGLYGVSLDNVLGLRSGETKRILLSPEERKLLLQLKELSPELRDLIYKEVEILFSANQVKKK